MVQNVLTHGWDGEWFLRAYDAFGKKIGSKECTDGQIWFPSTVFPSTVIEETPFIFPATTSLLTLIPLPWIKRRASELEGARPAATRKSPRFADRRLFPPDHRHAGRTSSSANQRNFDIGAQCDRVVTLCKRIKNFVKADRLDIRGAHFRYAEEIVRMYHREQAIAPAAARYQEIASYSCQGISTSFLRRPAPEAAER